MARPDPVLPELVICVEMEYTVSDGAFFALCYLRCGEGLSKIQYVSIYRRELVINFNEFKSISTY